MFYKFCKGNLRVFTFLFLFQIRWESLYFRCQWVFLPKSWFPNKTLIHYHWKHCELDRQEIVKYLSDYNVCFKFLVFNFALYPISKTPKSRKVFCSFISNYDSSCNLRFRNDENELRQKLKVIKWIKNWNKNVRL